MSQTESTVTEKSENKNIEKQTFSMNDLKCEKVVVFQDRAEVKRLIKTTIKKGENELIINSIPSSIDRDSVRVEGHGNATVLDVVCQNKTVKLDEMDTNNKLKDLKTNLKELEVKQEDMNCKLGRINKQIQILNEFANTLSSKQTNSSDEKNYFSVSSKQNVENFLDFIDTYSNKFEQLDDKKLQVQREIENLNEQIQVARDNLSKLSSPYYKTNETIEITILVEGLKDTNEIFLHVSYVVYNASWTPKYDIRVFSNDKTMIINYFGLIVQSTGEDWNDTQLSLSTAVPSIGGNVPELETQNVRVKQQIRMYKSFKSPKNRSVSKLQSYDLFDQEQEFSTLESEDIAKCSAEPMADLQTNVKTTSVGSTTTFDIPRQATIPSDNNTHKVSIGILNLKPDFEYETVPKKNAHAYIKAKVTNTTQYAMLAGPANVFLDNNFVAKTDLKSYSPQEEFYCSLGVDPAIRIDYKPLRKFKAQTGLITRSTTTTYVQVIEVKNTTTNFAKILLTENLPLSSDEKIQIKLLEPVIHKNNQNIRINKSNNVEFDLNIPPSKTEEITFKYTIDHPTDKDIEFF